MRLRGRFMDAADLPSSLGSVWAPGDGPTTSPPPPPLPRPRTHPTSQPPYIQRHTGKDQAHHLYHVILLNPAAPTAVSKYGFQIQSPVIMQMECFKRPLRKEPAREKKLVLVSEAHTERKINEKYPIFCQIHSRPIRFFFSSI